MSATPIIYDEDAVREALNKAVEKHGTSEEVARQTGVSGYFVRQCVAGNRPVTGTLLAWLGFETLPRTYKRVRK